VDPKNFRFAADVEYTAKRGLDLFLGALIFIAFAIFLPIIALGIKRSSKGPVLEKQPHTGKHGHIFLCYKFRTTHTTGNTSLNRQINKSVNPLHFSFGEFLESSSLKHLPSILNVLQGEMSLVGPRPLLTEYLPLYTAEQSRRHEVRPGVTGWAQVNGRNAISWEQKFKLDVWYVDNHSLWLDLKIIWMTLRKVVQRDGIAAEGSVTMPRFKGSK